MKISDIDKKELTMEVACFYEGWKKNNNPPIGWKSVFNLQARWDRLVFYRQYKYEAIAEELIIILKRIQSRKE